MLGSSIAAVLTYMFGVQVPAPHGGFLVLPVVTGKIAWVGSILLGSIIGGVILGFIQNAVYKNVKQKFQLMNGKKQRKNRKEEDK